MKNLNSKELIKLGKIHKKWTELVTMNNFPYLVNNKRYYLAYYYPRFTTNVNSYAVVSPDSGNKRDSDIAFKPLVYFSITISNIDLVVTKRASLKYNVWLEVRNYLKSVLEDNVLDYNLEIYYERSYKIIEKMISLQEEMIQMKEEYDKFVKIISDRGYFIDEDIDKSLKLAPTINWLQYDQFTDRYKYRHDFDVIYENQNNWELKKYMNAFRDKSTLYNMTSKVAEKQIKETLDLLGEGSDLSHMTQNQLLISLGLMLIMMHRHN
jgi:hypothetical protein